MRRANILFAIFISLTVVMAATLVVTKPAILSQAFQLQISTLLLHLCGAILFLLAIKSFRPSLKSAYRFMSAGASMLLLGIIQIYTMQFLGVYENPWVAKLGFSEIPFIFMASFFYIGIRTFAKVSSIQTWLTNAKIVYTLAIIAGLVVGLALGLTGPAKQFDSLFALRFFNLLIFIFGAMLSWQVWQSTSSLYKQAFVWFSIYLTVTVFNTSCGFLQGIGWITWFVEVSVLLFHLTGLLLSISAWQFNRVAYAEKSETKADKNVVKGSKTSVDVVLFLAGFASNQTTIDPIMDSLRLITASSTYDGRPSEKDQPQLANVYLQLEDYLVTKEPLRKFEQKDLRQMVESQFKQAVDEPLFWQQITLTSSLQTSTAPTPQL